jgi:hypothetical protein
MYQLLFITSFLFAVALFIRFRRRRTISPSDFFFTALFIQYGIHAGLSPNFLQLSDFANNASIYYEKYLLGLSIAYLGSIFGFVLGRRIFVFNATPRGPEAHNQEYLMWLLVVSISLLIFMMVLQGAGLPVTAEYIKYFLGVSSYDYTYIRRVMFDGHPYVIGSEMLRYSVTALIYSGLVYFVLHARSKGRRVLYIATLLCIFILAGMQLNKYPFIYFLGLIILVIFYDRLYRGTTNITIRSYFYAVLAFFGFLFLIFIFYIVQYRDTIINGSLSYHELSGLVIYRAFFASNDALRLWFQAFPEMINYTGITNIGLLRVFGVEYVNVTTVIPEIFLGDVLTSLQAGYIGSAYASFGFIGIGVVSFIVGVIASYCDYFSGTRRSLFGRVVVASVLSLNLVSFTSREFHTALVSGGVFSVIFAIGLGYLLRSYFRSSVMSVSLRGVYATTANRGKEK